MIRFDPDDAVNISATIKRYEERLRADRPEQKLALQAEEMINDTI